MNPSTPFRQSKTVLITGASSGIGYEFTRLFSREGYNLVLVARNQVRLREIADDLSDRHGVQATVIAADLSVPGSPAEVFEQVQKEGIVVDSLMNNAGFATYGLFAELDIDKELEMMQVNMVALTQLTRLFLPGMLKRHAGRIMNVASTAAFQPGPLMAVYYASKAYVLSFSEALAEELRGSGVTVTALCPGPTRSGFQKRAKMEDSRLVQGRLMDAAAVAQSGYQAMLKGETIVIPGLQNRIMAEAVRFVPRNVVTRIVRKAQERSRQ